MKEIVSYFKKGFGIGAGLGLGFLGTSLLAVAISTFHQGEILTAGKLNENFQALKAAVDELSASNGNYSIVDSTGKKLATSTTIGWINSKGFEVSGFVAFYLPSDTGSYGNYYDAGSIVYYTSANCTGFPYAINSSRGIIRFLPIGSNFFYISLNATPEHVTLNSAYYSGGCSASSMGSVYAFRFLANDPAVTGFDPSAYTPPFRYSP